MFLSETFKVVKILKMCVLIIELRFFEDLTATLKKTYCS